MTTPLALRSLALRWLRGVRSWAWSWRSRDAATPGLTLDVDLRPPSTAKEQAAARVAVKFAAPVQDRQAAEACALTRGAAWRTLRCSRAPRIPAWLRIPPRKRADVIDVTPAKVSRAIRLGLVPGRPVLAVEVDRSGRVVAHYGYA